MNSPLVYLGALQVKMYGASSGVVDLGASGVIPRQVGVQADLRSNTSYKVGLALSDASSSTLGTAYAAACLGLGFANQPQNDGIEIVSNSASDTQVATVYGTTTGTGIVVAEAITLTGTSAVASVKTDWGYILGIELSSAAVGTVTIREASANATIITIAAAASSSGVTSVATASQSAHLLPFRAVGSTTSAKVVGVVGTDAAGNTIYDSIALPGATTAVHGTRAFKTITKLLTGDMETTGSRTCSFSVGSLTWGGAAASLTDLGSDQDNEFEVTPDRRYLHWCFYNGTTAANGGENDILLVKLFG